MPSSLQTTSAGITSRIINTIPSLRPSEKREFILSAAQALVSQSSLDDLVLILHLATEALKEQAEGQYSALWQLRQEADAAERQLASKHFSPDCPQG